MSWLPSDTVLGDLSIVETFVFYDGPRVFSARSLTDQYYLALWVDSNERGDTWLYVPVSEARLNMIRSGGIFLRDSITSAEGFVYQVALPHDAAGTDEAMPIRPVNVPDDWLPDEDASLSLDVFTLPSMSEAEIFSTQARQEHRTKLRIRVRLPQYTRSEAPAQTIGKILVATQSLYDNLGYRAEYEEPSLRGRVPNEVSRRTSASLTGLSAASFVIELAADQPDDIFGDSLFARITRQVLDLLGNDPDPASLTPSVQALKVRAAKSFRNFVENLADAQGDVTLAAAGSSLQYVERELNEEHLGRFVETLKRIVPKEDVSIIRGVMRLHNIDTRRHRFGFTSSTAPDEVIYEGRIDDRAMPMASHATVEELYDVIIEGVTTLDESVGEEKTTYSLLQLTPHGEDS